MRWGEPADTRGGNVRPENSGPPHRQKCQARADAHAKEDWRQLMGEAAAWRTELLAAFDDGEPADGERAMDLAEEHRGHLTRWFTPCPPDMHRRLVHLHASPHPSC